LLKTSWTEKITNEEVRKRIGEGKSILRTIQQRKLELLTRSQTGGFVWITFVMIKIFSLIGKPKLPKLEAVA